MFFVLMIAIFFYPFYFDENRTNRNSKLRSESLFVSSDLPLRTEINLIPLNILPSQLCSL